jgi:hypothetical protein
VPPPMKLRPQATHWPPSGFSRWSLNPPK